LPMSTMHTQEQSYYDVLNVSRTASQAEIKRAFRTLAKKYHPDTNPEQSKSAATRLKDVMVAYKVLSNERERARYDILLQTSPAFSSSVRASRADSSASQAKRILEDMLSGEGERALEAHDRLKAQEGFDLEVLLDTRDYLDCVFLLAEQMERVGRDREATELYEELYAREKEPPRHRYFFEEVKMRLKKLYSRKLPREARSPEEEIACYKRILEFDVDRSEKAFILKKIAEVYLKVGQTEEAKKVFQEALELKPGLKGTATIRERLGYDSA